MNSLSTRSAESGINSGASRFRTAVHRTSVANGELRKLVSQPAAYSIEYNGGLRTTLLMLNGAIKDFTFAARVKGMAAPQSTQFLMTPIPSVSYSACLVSKIEEMF